MKTDDLFSILQEKNYRTCSEWLAGDGNVEHIIEYTLQLIETNKLHL